jgi:peroxiredoxin
VLLRDRSDDLAVAGVRPLAISRDSPWSHAAWARQLGVDLPLLSDWNGEAVRAFGIAAESRGMSDVAQRSSFLVEDGLTIRASWMHGADLPDIDAILTTVRALA